MKKKILLIFVLIFIINLSAQQIHRCSTTEYIDFLSQTDFSLKDRINETFEKAKLHSESLMSFKATAPTTIYRIPVVFHVVYKTAQENISDALLMSQLDVLNADFRKLNADTTNHRAVFKDRAADVGFDFFLATIDPNGNLTTGITRTETTTDAFGGIFPIPDHVDEVKFTASGGIDAWDTENYMNIWVCNTGGSILGLAYPPTNAPNWGTPSQTPTDTGKWGIVISHQVIGFNNPLATGPLSIADQGRTLIHETGHFFGLRHIWGDAGFFGSIDCDITKDDGIDDTPHMGNNSQNDGCDFSKNTCTNGETPDEPDMPENYMDYSEESCQNMFTEGQASILQSMAVIGRPDLAYVIKDDTLLFNIGDYVVINGDTILITASTIISINSGDSIMLLNENNGYYYTATNSGSGLANTLQLEVATNGDAAINSIPTAIFDLSTTNHLASIFPNPSNDEIILKNESLNNFNRIKIIDINGKVCLTFNFKNVSQKTIDIKKLTNGLYFVSFYNDDKIFAIKKLSVIK